MMRMEETAAEEEDYWRENWLQRWRRDYDEFFATASNVLSNAEALHFNTRIPRLPVQS